MKNLFFITAMLFSSFAISQTNRYSEVTPSTYGNTNTQNVYISSQSNNEEYYRRQAENRASKIVESLDFFYENFNYILDSDYTDSQLKEDIRKIYPTLNYLASTQMSLSSAESYVHKISKKYNKAVKKYKKRNKKRK